jgi:hypothetical protein
MKQRFNKHNVALSTWQQINFLEKEFKFNTYNGWEQVSGKGEAINRAYGTYEALLQLTNDFDLPYTID